jgi:hypothetical protein
MLDQNGDGKKTGAMHTWGIFPVRSFPGSVFYFYVLGRYGTENRGSRRRHHTEIDVVTAMIAPAVVTDGATQVSPGSLRNLKFPGYAKTSKPGCGDFTPPGGDSNHDDSREMC